MNEARHQEDDRCRPPTCLLGGCNGKQIAENPETKRLFSFPSLNRRTISLASCNAEFLVASKSQGKWRRKQRHWRATVLKRGTNAMNSSLPCDLSGRPMLTTPGGRTSCKWVASPTPSSGDLDNYVHLQGQSMRLFSFRCVILWTNFLVFLSLSIHHKILALSISCWVSSNYTEMSNLSRKECLPCRWRSQTNSSFSKRRLYL